MLNNLGTLLFTGDVQYIPRNMRTVFALLCFVVVIHWLILPYPSGLLYWHCGNLTIAPVPAKQPWWLWINTSCEFIMKDCITTTKQSTTKPCAYFLGYTVYINDGILWSSLLVTSIVNIWRVKCSECVRSMFRKTSLSTNLVAMHMNWLHLVPVLTNNDTVGECHSCGCCQCHQGDVMYTTYWQISLWRWM